MIVLTFGRCTDAALKGKASGMKQGPNAELQGFGGYWQDNY